MEIPKDIAGFQNTLNRESKHIPMSPVNKKEPRNKYDLLFAKIAEMEQHAKTAAAPRNASGGMRGSTDETRERSGAAAQPSRKAKEWKANARRGELGASHVKYKRLGRVRKDARVAGQ